MQKDNVFRSSSFYMGINDVLKILILDEAGDEMSFELKSGGNYPTKEEEIALDVVPGKPIISDISDVTVSSFTANWSYMENSTGYYLDVATDSAFSSMVAGYNNKDVGNVIYAGVTGLNGSTPYYCRIRAYNSVGSSVSSDTKTATTIANPNLVYITTTQAGVFSLDLYGSGTVNINWGDGVVDTEALAVFGDTYTHSYVSGGTFSISNPAGITILRALGQDVTSAIIPKICTVLQTVSLGNNLLTSFITHPEWTAMESLGLDFNQLTSLVLHPEWVNIILLQLDNNALTSFTAYATWTALQQLQLEVNNITSATDINNILIALDTAVMSAGDILLDLGTNAAPTGLGIVAKNNLTGRGVNVETN